MQSQGEDSDEDFEERELTRAAANHGTEKAILLAAENKRKVPQSDIGLRCLEMHKSKTLTSVSSKYMAFCSKE